MRYNIMMKAIIATIIVSFFFEMEPVQRVVKLQNRVVCRNGISIVCLCLFVILFFFYFTLASNINLPETNLNRIFKLLTVYI